MTTQTATAVQCPNHDADQICPDCCHGGRYAVSTLTANGTLPVLTGSPKQIAWATKIRNAVISGARTMQAAAEEGFFAAYARNEATEGIWAELAAEILRTVAGRPTARYWIDNRFTATDTIYGIAVSAVMGAHPEVAEHRTAN